jgi:hypothetical protein
MSIKFHLSWQPNNGFPYEVFSASCDHALIYLNLDDPDHPTFTTDPDQATSFTSYEKINGMMKKLTLVLVSQLPPCDRCGGEIVHHAASSDSQPVLQCTECGRVGWA